MRPVLARLGQGLLTLMAGSFLVWCLLLLVPGDPAARVLQARGILEPDPASVAAVRTELDLDRPALLRYLLWLTDAVRGDLGVSWTTGRSVSGEFADRLPATARLMIAAMGIAILLAVILAVVAVSGPGRWPDVLSRTLSLAMLVMPGFLLAVVLLDILVVKMGLGRVIADGSWSTVGMPAVVLALASAAGWSRVLRAGLLQTRGSGYAQVATARGGSRGHRLRVHEIPGALPPFITLVGLGTAGLLGGAPVVESVFTWPGIGRYVVSAINARDAPVIAAYTLLAVLVYVVVSAGVDVLLQRLDPRLAVRPQRPQATDRAAPLSIPPVVKEEA